MDKWTPIFGNNFILGHYPSWWRSKVCEYKYLLGQGEFFIGEIESLITFGGIGTMIAVGAKYLWGWTLPFWGIILFTLSLRILKIYLGKLDRDYLKMGQAMQEYSIRAKLSPTGNEMFDRIKNIEKKVAPETYKEEHTTYVK